MSKPRWRNPDKRMARAVELRAQGWSLRRIGTELAVGKSTVERDLARWAHQQEQQTVRPTLRIVQSTVPSVSHPPVPSDPDGTPQWDGTSVEGEAG